MASSADQLVQQALQSGHLELYLDTTFLLDLVRPERRPKSAELFEEARSRGWTCSSSAFAQMEALDVEQENAWFLARVRAGEHIERLLRRRRERDLGKNQLLRVFKRFSVALEKRGVRESVQWIALGDEETERAMNLAMETNMSAPDCLHVATALQAGCDVLVTSDGPLRDAARSHITAVTPEELLKALRGTAE